MSNVLYIFENTTIVEHYAILVQVVSAQAVLPDMRIHYHVSFHLIFKYTTQDGRG
jgi:hypothetical protein